MLTRSGLYKSAVFHAVSDFFLVLVFDFDVIPLHKNGNTLDQGNHRPISLLPIVSKHFGRLMANQFQHYFNLFFFLSIFVDFVRDTAASMLC